jgi:hypothetical protein
MSDEKFYKEIKFMFEEYLSPKKDRLQIRVKNLEKDSILSEKEMNYSKVFFDSELNMYKIGKDGNLERVDNDNFEAVVMKQE